MSKRHVVVFVCFCLYVDFRQPTVEILISILVLSKFSLRAQQSCLQLICVQLPNRAPSPNKNLFSTTAFVCNGACSAPPTRAYRRTYAHAHLQTHAHTHKHTNTHKHTHTHTRTIPMDALMRSYFEVSSEFGVLRASAKFNLIGAVFGARICW